MKLNKEQSEALLDWLRGRRGMIEEDWEDLGMLKPLLSLIEEPKK